MAKRLSIKGKEETAICRPIAEFVSHYLNGELDAETAKSFERHLAICPDCLSFLKTFKKTLELTRSFLSTKAMASDLTRVQRSLKKKLNLIKPARLKHPTRK